MSKQKQLSPIAESPASVDDTPVDRVEFADVTDRIEQLNNRMDSMKEVSRDVIELKSNIQLILQKLNSMEHSQIPAESSNVARNLSPEFQRQVPFFHSEPGRRNEDDIRREKLLKNVEFPMFAGENLYGWIARVERYARIAQFTETQILDQVSISLADDALGWYHWEINRLPFRSWRHFKDRILLRFGNLRVKEPSQSLFCIKQTGSVVQYVRSFEDLSSQVSGLDDNKLEGIFLNGLQPEMQELVYMMKPNSLLEMIATALSMEDSHMRKSMSHFSSWEPSAKKGTLELHKSFSSYTDTIVLKPNIQEPTKTQDKTTTLTFPRQQKTHTREELDEMRKRQICFCCYGKWDKDHRQNCPSKELRVLTVLDEFVVEVLQDEELVEYLVPEAAAECRTLSFYSFMGISTPTTTKMRASFGKTGTVIMLDSGATHNFINPALAQRLKLKEKASSTLNILLGTGVTVKGSGTCLNVSFTIQGVTFSTDFITLELGQVDVLLGIQWLQTLGECRVNWDTHEYSFLYKGTEVKLKGDSDLQLSHLTIQPPNLLLDNDMEMVLARDNAKRVEIVSVPAAVEKVLSLYPHVFANGVLSVPNKTAKECWKLWFIDKANMLMRILGRVLPHQFPDLSLEDKLVVKEGGIDKPLNVYVRRNTCKSQASEVTRENISEQEETRAKEKHGNNEFTEAIELEEEGGEDESKLRNGQRSLSTQDG